jgi:hypothetical protein
MQALLAKQVAWNGGVQTVREVQVLSSELTREGPIYTVLSREKLLGEVDAVE